MLFQLAYRLLVITVSSIFFIIIIFLKLRFRAYSILGTLHLCNPCMTHFTNQDTGLKDYEGRSDRVPGTEE